MVSRLGQAFLLSGADKVTSFSVDRKVLYISKKETQS